MKSFATIQLSLAGQFRLMVICSMVFYISSAHANGVTEESPVYTQIVEGGDYLDILGTVKQIIQGRGISIAHTLAPAEMLNRTGPDFGITKPVLKDGEMVEFCSAKISHQLIQANPENITLCPFAISVYVLASDPGNVRLTFRQPYVIDAASQAAVSEMTSLVKGIITEAADW